MHFCLEFLILYDLNSNLRLNLYTSEPTTSSGVSSANEISNETHVEIDDKIPTETHDQYRNEHDTGKCDNAS